MKLKKTLAAIAAGALCVTMGAAVLAGCGGKGTDYTFQAEDAELCADLRVQKGNEWSANNDGAEVTVVSYFANPGQTITWKVTAASDCKVTLKLRASSCAFGALDASNEAVDLGMLMGILQGGGTLDEGTKGYISELKAADCGSVLKVNDAEVTMNGTLPSTTIEIEDGNYWALMGVYSVIHCGEYTATANLKKGENTIVLEVVTGGFNVDSLTVNSSAKITFDKTDNSDRLPQQ